MATQMLGSLAILRGRLNEGERRMREASQLASGRRRESVALFDSNEIARDDAWFRNQPERAVRLLDSTLAALAAVYKRLAELYDAQGKRAKAVSHYAAFIDLWKNADPELQPRVAEAKKRLAQLTNAERQ